MKRPASRLPRPLARLDRLSAAARSRLATITDFADPLIILPYLGYGNSERLLLGGRVLEDEGFTPAASIDRTWRNLVNMYRRFETDEVPGARVRARLHDSETETTGDEEGYFSFEIERHGDLKSSGWQDVELELVDPPSANKQPVRATARVLVPAATARFGVISDIDDTVIASHVGNKLRMVLTVLLSNAHTRKPFEGVAGLYRALRDGASGADDNPVFYLSNSPWNLYTLLVEFLTLQRIPLGPLLLRDFGDHLFFARDPGSHKRSNIKKLFESFPDLPFVLIGDSGERDPEIYADVVREFPGRVRVIYIRSINKHPSRLAAIEKLVAEVRQTDTQLVLVPDSEFAAAHAAAEGLICTESLPLVRAEKTKDETAPAQDELTR